MPKLDRTPAPSSFWLLQTQLRQLSGLFIKLLGTRQGVAHLNLPIEG